MVKTFILVCLSFMAFLVFPKLDSQTYINSEEEKNSFMQILSSVRELYLSWKHSQPPPAQQPYVRSSLPSRAFIYSVFIPSPWKWIHFVWFSRNAREIVLENFYRNQEQIVYMKVFTKHPCCTIIPFYFTAKKNEA